MLRPEFAAIEGLVHDELGLGQQVKVVTAALDYRGIVHFGEVVVVFVGVDKSSFVVLHRRSLERVSAIRRNLRLGLSNRWSSVTLDHIDGRRLLKRAQLRPALSQVFIRHDQLAVGRRLSEAGN